MNEQPFAPSFPSRSSYHQQIDDDTLQVLLEEIGTVSSIYHKPSETFITPAVGPKPIDEVGEDTMDLDEEDDDEYDDEGGMGEGGDDDDDLDIFAEEQGGVSGGEEEDPNFLF